MPTHSTTAFISGSQLELGSLALSSVTGFHNFSSPIFHQPLHEVTWGFVGNSRPPPITPSISSINIKNFVTITLAKTQQLHGYFDGTIVQHSSFVVEVMGSNLLTLFILFGCV